VTRRQRTLGRSVRKPARLAEAATAARWRFSESLSSPTFVAHRLPRASTSTFGRAAMPERTAKSISGHSHTS
jgi:hypothetical protein